MKYKSGIVQDSTFFIRLANYGEIFWKSAFFFLTLRDNSGDFASASLSAIVRGGFFHVIINFLEHNNTEWQH